MGDFLDFCPCVPPTVTTTGGLCQTDFDQKVKRSLRTLYMLTEA